MVALELNMQLAEAVLSRMNFMVTAPMKNMEMLWSVIPLIISFIVLQLYFGRYKEEELGWNTAVSNSLIWLFVGANLMRYLYSTGGVSINDPRTMVSLSVIGLGFVILFLNFNHLWPEGLAFTLSSALIINYHAFISILFVYTNIPMDSVTVLAATALFVVLVVLDLIVRIIEPEIF